MSTTTILLADDHPVVRLGLRTLLEQEPEFQVIGEAFDGLETVRMARNLDPDVLILDLMMPGMNGIYVTSEVKQSCPRTRVIILSMHASEMYVRETFSRGADGYVLKDMAATEIIKAIRTVMDGRRYMGDLTDDSEINAFSMHPPVRTNDPCGSLTAREREILHFVAKGRQSKEIAEHCVISVRTVEKHRAKIMRKLNLRNTAELINFAVQKKIV